MRHQKAGRKFGRNTSHRRAMFRALAGNLVLHEKIVTTDAKAKELRRVVERLVSKAARLGDDLVVDLGKLKDQQRQSVAAKRMHAQRLVARFLPKTMHIEAEDGSSEPVDLVHKLFHDLAPRYLARINNGKGGGYTRIVKLGTRRGDNAPLSLIEFVETDSTSKTGGADETKGKKKSAKDEGSQSETTAAKASTKKEKAAEKQADSAEKTPKKTTKKKATKKVA